MRPASADTKLKFHARPPKESTREQRVDEIRGGDSDPLDGPRGEAHFDRDLDQVRDGKVEPEERGETRWTIEGFYEDFRVEVLQYEEREHHAHRRYGEPAAERR